ncbi:hypothetical protein ACIOJF_16835 [Glutamicibacter sp. NPDC087831]|uniref:hypothetical protein n=1 Tax=Glutamicibacter sp. NPDC087831 TaxID=3363998 RepID=UPI00380C6CB6
MAQKGIVGTTTLMVLGWTVFVLGLVGLFVDPLVGALLAIAGAVLLSGGMITEALNRKREASAVLQNSSEKDITASEL